MEYDAERDTFYWTYNFVVRRMPDNELQVESGVFRADAPNRTGYAREHSSAPVALRMWLDGTHLTAGEAAKIFWNHMSKLIKEDNADTEGPYPTQHREEDLRTGIVKTWWAVRKDIPNW